jgi:hypothetical protein
MVVLHSGESVTDSHSHTHTHTRIQCAVFPSFPVHTVLHLFSDSVLRGIARTLCCDAPCCAVFIGAINIRPWMASRRVRNVGEADERTLCRLYLRARECSLHSFIC